MDVETVSATAIIVQTVKDCSVIKVENEELLVQSINNWLKLYEAKSIQREIISADSWLLENGKTKKNYLRFIGNWLRRSNIHKYTGGRSDIQSDERTNETSDGVYKYKII